MNGKTCVMSEEPKKNNNNNNLIDFRFTPFPSIWNYFRQLAKV